MFAPRVAKRYAQALFGLAKEKNLLEDLAREMQDLHTALLNSRELFDFVRDPVLTKDEKSLVIRRIFEKQAHPVVFHFLLFLIEKRRLNMIEPICEVFHSLYLNEKNIADVQLTAAMAIDRNQTDAIVEKLRSKFRKEMRVQVRTDAGLIGGIKLRIEDMVYDFSLKTQLEKFRQSIV